ncbi:hypothetical protein BT96DRAFT_199559 [Gymnopus androsaceus JB14]|uniref:Uncharacterized protein n=1 Tax=Gymnopus androsaceus JB14 TaxID=1447944 RepID=A0A6A4HA12_9AGAR|nr:hypothetical protein BT96DRAFT_199559 [Gymnopus androsaceus JB14]
MSLSFVQEYFEGKIDFVGQQKVDEISRLWLVGFTTLSFILGFALRISPNHVWAIGCVDGCAGCSYAYSLSLLQIQLYSLCCLNWPHLFVPSPMTWSGFLRRANNDH